jgi:hypothetical protein
MRGDLLSPLVDIGSEAEPHLLDLLLLSQLIATDSYILGGVLLYGKTVVNGCSGESRKGSQNSKKRRFSLVKQLSLVLERTLN